MEALLVKKGKAPKGQPNPELRIYDGVIGLVTYDEEGVATEKFMGINSVVDGLIFDEWHKDGDEYVIAGLNRDKETVEFRFEPAKGYIRGLVHIFEEIRKGKESVKVRDMKRKVLFTRMRKGTK